MVTIRVYSLTFTLIFVLLTNEVGYSRELAARVLGESNCFVPSLLTVIVNYCINSLCFGSLKLEKGTGSKRPSFLFLLLLIMASVVEYRILHQRRK